jgi:hypothetical protein
MAEAGRWKPYTQRKGQLLPAFVEDALEPGDPVLFISGAVEPMDLTAGGVCCAPGGRVQFPLAAR